jgi:hypothetical protein
MFSLTGRTRSIIGMAHLKPLPGSPLYDPGGGMQAIIDGAAQDIAALQSGGIDAIMFGNEGDRPYLLKASPESLSAMATVVATLKPALATPRCSPTPESTATMSRRS